MLSDPLVLADDVPANHSYALIVPDAGNSVRKVTTAPANAPEVLLIKHQETTKGGIVSDRHLMRCDLTKINAVNVPVTASVYMVFEVPRDSAITVAMIRGMRTQLTAWLTTNANLDKILGGES